MPPAADEIRALAITLNGMLDRLAAGRERQRSFVADAAHELRSPLASIRTQLEVAERLGEGGTLPADLLVDLRPAVRGWSRTCCCWPGADADARPPARPRPWTAGHCSTEVAAAYAGARVPVTVRTGAGRVTCMADAGELRRAVDNLVANAVRHADSAVELARTWPGSEVRAHGPRRRPRHGRGGPGAGLRAVHPAGRRAGPGLGWLGTRAGHRPGAGAPGGRRPSR